MTDISQFAPLLSGAPASDAAQHDPMRNADIEVLRLQIEAAEAFARTEQARAAEIAEQLAHTAARLRAIESSTSWRLTALPRSALSGIAPWIRTAKQLIRLFWWSITFRLPSQLRAQHRHKEALARMSDATQKHLFSMLDDWLKRAWANPGVVLKPALTVPLLEKYLEASGLNAEAARVWAHLLTNFPRRSALGQELNLVITSLRESTRFETSVNQVIGSPFFNTQYYGDRHMPQGTSSELAMHYLLIGEPLGLQPSDEFAPSYYSEWNVDVTLAGVGGLLHYTAHGQREGRHPKRPPTVVQDFETPDPALIVFTATVERWLEALHDQQRDTLPFLSPTLLALYLRASGLEDEALTRCQKLLLDRSADAVTLPKIAAAIAENLFQNPTFETRAAHISQSADFDDTFYCEQASLIDADPDAARHYLLIGEPLGIRPSFGFDPSYYASQYPDVAEAGMGLLLHYAKYGKEERRAARALEIRHTQRKVQDSSRENVIVVVHETSRTGAPILAWNIIDLLSRKYNVHTIHLGDGALTPAFEHLSVETYGPFSGVRSKPEDLEKALQTLLSSKVFKYAIVNSIESRPMLYVCSKHAIATLMLVHEFGSYVWPTQSLKDALDSATEVVFPAPIVAQSSIAMHPALVEHGYHIEPQGMSRIPPDGEIKPFTLPLEIIELQGARDAGAFIVIGAGSVNLRKGVDLFISAAAYAQRLDIRRPVHFLWIGGGFRPEQDMGYSIYLKEQIDRSQLRGSITFIDEIAELEAIYQLAHVFLLTSRLDPLPNVSIDALCRGIPTICFRDASGTADLMLADPATTEYVVEHLDAKGAADIIGRLASNQALYEQSANAALQLGKRSFDMERYVGRLDIIASAMTVDPTSIPNETHGATSGI